MLGGSALVVCALQLVAQPVDLIANRQQVGSALGNVRRQLRQPRLVTLDFSADALMFVLGFIVSSGGALLLAAQVVLLEVELAQRVIEAGAQVLEPLGD